jgi:type IV secretory pathway VirB2 component (pilin)
MSFRTVNEKYLLPASQILMVLGIIALCQPWSLGLHSYGVTIILIGLIGFNITSKIAPERAEETGATTHEGARQ